MRKAWTSVLSKTQALFQALRMQEQAKLMGVDKYGNRFIQMLNSDGSEGRRLMEPPQDGDQSWARFNDFDRRWEPWLRKADKHPPDAEGLKDAYKREAKSRENAMLWAQMEKKRKTQEKKD